jgi:osmoprotectant transport system ATP-binding protein
MGDLVAVMQEGGHLAQFGTPDEILGNPASDFVARFVGADRGLKRLALSRIDQIDLRPAITGRPGEDAALAAVRLRDDPLGYLLLVDSGDRPIGWIARRHIPDSGILEESMAAPMSPLLDRRTTLKDALAMLIDAEVQAGIVVDRRGAVRGTITAEDITSFARREPDPRT